MTESFVPPVVLPSRGSSAVRGSSGTRPAADGRPLPVTELAALPADDSLVCRMASVDSRGRVAEQSLVRALGWDRTQRLEIRVISGAIVIHANPTGVFTLARRGHVPIPAAVRRWCAVRPGDRVLLALDARQSALVIHTMAAVEEMLRARHAALLGGDPA